MNNQVFAQGGRFLLIVALQVLLFKQIGVEMGVYFSVFIYPAFILFLPRELSTVTVLLLGFFVGITIDLFYTSIGLHAAASVFSAYARGFLLKKFEPRSGYKDAPIPSKGNLGWQWFLPFAAIFMALHLFFYFAVDAFTFVYIKTIILKTIAAWLLSMAFLLIYTVTFNPRT